MDQRHAQPVKAAFWMLGSIASFTLMAVGGRAVQVELASYELMFWRSLAGFLIIAGLIRWRRGSFAPVRTRHWHLHLVRNTFHFFGQNMWFAGLMLIPLSQLVALEFTMPIWVALMAPLFLGEALTGKKIAVALIGFAGVLVVAQPGLQPVGWGHAAGMAAAIGFAINLIYTRKIMLHDEVLCVLFWMTASQGAMGLVLALGLGDGFTWPSMALLPWLALVAVTGLTAHFCLTTALGLAPAMLVAPMEFARLPIIATVGVLVYAEALDPWVFVGGALIFAANLWNMRPARAPRPA